MSVVTVVYRDPQGLQRTLDSIAGLPPNYELVVVEGESSEKGTALRIVDSLVAGRRVKVIQGVDGGPYDAMNRGILASSGRWIWFVNAGDEVIEGIDVGMLDGCLRGTRQPWVAGTARVIESDGSRTKSFGRIEDLRRGVDTPCHQAILVDRVAIMATGMFDTRFKISADLLMMCRLAQVAPPAVLGTTIVAFHRGGMSEVRWRRREMENFVVRAAVTKLGVRRITVDLIRLGWRMVTGSSGSRTRESLTARDKLPSGK